LSGLVFSICRAERPIWTYVVRYALFPCLTRHRRKPGNVRTAGRTADTALSSAAEHQYQAPGPEAGPRPKNMPPSSGPFEGSRPDGSVGLVDQSLQQPTGRHQVRSRDIVSVGTVARCRDQRVVPGHLDGDRDRPFSGLKPRSRLPQIDLEHVVRLSDPASARLSTGRQIGGIHRSGHPPLDQSGCRPAELPGGQDLIDQRRRRMTVGPVRPFTLGWRAPAGSRPTH
jgi:hypothetical protein